MQTILQLLNKIKWSKDKTGYRLEYFDRIYNELKEIEFKDIKEINRFSIVLNGKEIPLHRIRNVWKGNMGIWKRYSKL